MTGLDASGLANRTTEGGCDGRRGRSSCCYFFFSSRRRHTRCSRDWSSDVCSSDLQFSLAPSLLLSLCFSLRLGFGGSRLFLCLDTCLVLTLCRERACVLRELYGLPGIRHDVFLVRLCTEGVLGHLQARRSLSKDLRCIFICAA